MPVNQYAFCEGVRLSNSSHGGIIYAATPVIVTLAMCMLKVERWTVAAIGGAALALAGVVVIMMQSLSQQSAANAFWKGDLLLIVAVTTWSLYLVISRPLTLRYGALNVRNACVYRRRGAGNAALRQRFSDHILGRRNLGIVGGHRLPGRDGGRRGVFSFQLGHDPSASFKGGNIRQAAPPLTLLWNA